VYREFFGATPCSGVAGEEKFWVSIDARFSEVRGLRSHYKRDMVFFFIGGAFG